MLFRNKFYILLFLLIVFLSYSSFIYLYLPENKVHSPAADQGKMVWQKYNCGACHQVYGLGGYLGPDLTNVLSRRDSSYISALIKHGTEVMPVLGASDEEISSLIEYFKALDKSGTADPRSFKIQKDGYITQEID